MSEEAVMQYIMDTFPGVGAVEVSGNHFFFSEPDGDRRHPFATLVTNDLYEVVSNLNRPGVYRLNIGVSREFYRALFGPEALRPIEAGSVETGHDFSALDQIMPHPVYAPQFWLCVLNPSEATFDIVKPLLAEAYDRSARRRARSSGTDRT